WLSRRQVRRSVTRFLDLNRRFLSFLLFLRALGAFPLKRQPRAHARRSDRPRARIGHAQHLIGDPIGLLLELSAGHTDDMLRPNLQGLRVVLAARTTSAASAGGFALDHRTVKG